VAAFTHPLCTDFRDLLTELRASGQRVDRHRRPRATRSAQHGGFAMH
jgi:hypothetical protein